jgi:hypothetical protein
LGDAEGSFNLKSSVSVHRVKEKLSFEFFEKAPRGNAHAGQKATVHHQHERNRGSAEKFFLRVNAFVYRVFVGSGIPLKFRWRRRC